MRYQQLIETLDTTIEILENEIIKSPARARQNFTLIEPLMNLREKYVKMAKDSVQVEMVQEKPKKHTVDIEVKRKRAK